MVTAILILVVAFGLFALQGWARTVAMFVLVLRIGLDLWAIWTHELDSAIAQAAIGQLVVSAFILWYLMSERVRQAFAR